VTVPVAPAGKGGRSLRIPLVWANLVHDRRRTAVGILGVSFSSILLFMQLGFLGSVRATAKTILEKLDFDILLVSPTYLYLYDSGTFPRLRLDQARSVAGVRETVPFYVGFNAWTSVPREGVEPGASQRAIFILGYDLERQPFRDESVRRMEIRVLDRIRGGTCHGAESPADLATLRLPDTVLIDRQSHEDFGTQAELDPCRSGAGERPPGPVVGTRKVEIVGSFDLAIGFGADGALLVDLENFLRLFGGRSPRDVSLGLIRTTGDPRTVADRLERLLPADDVRVYTREEILEQETAYWVREKPVGVIFGLGIVVACAVGIVFVYQILSSDISNRFGEFATLKAMGYPDRVVSSLVIKQALVLANAGYLPGLVVAAILDRLVTLATRMPVEMTLADAVGVYVATTTICTVSAVFSVGKVRKADPADLFV
jgi:putative ABC transport system permease protein